MAMAMAMLKIDENVNLLLELELFFTIYDFPPGTGLYIFQNIGQQLIVNTMGAKDRNFKLVTVTQFTKLE